MAVVETSQPAIIIGGYFPALGVVQSMGAKGVACWVCDPGRPVATRSRFARYWPIPDPREDERGMIERILQLVRTVGGKPVLIPTDDQYVLAMARHHDQLVAVASPCLARQRAAALVIDKNRFSEWASPAGHSVPRSIRPKDFTASFGFPVNAKPVAKSFFKDPPGGPTQGARAVDLRFVLIEDERGWEDYRSIGGIDLDQIVVQEYVPDTSADMYSIGIYADARSEIKGLFVGRKLRGYPALYGNTKLGQNDTVPDPVIEEVRTIVRALDLTGIAAFEYRRDSGTGRFRLVEINPRCWSWIVATASSPADIPWIAYRDLTGMSVAPVAFNRAPGSVKYVQLFSDLTSVLLRYRWDYPDWVMTPRQWLRSLKADSLVIAEFNRGDWPAAFWFAGLFTRQLVGFAARRLAGRR